MTPKEEDEYTAKLRFERNRAEKSEAAAADAEKRRCDERGKKRRLYLHLTVEEAKRQKAEADLAAARGEAREERGYNSRAWAILTGRDEGSQSGHLPGAVVAEARRVEADLAAARAAKDESDKLWEASLKAANELSAQREADLAAAEAECERLAKERDDARQDVALKLAGVDLLASERDAALSTARQMREALASLVCAVENFQLHDPHRETDARNVWRLLGEAVEVARAALSAVPTGAGCEGCKRLRDVLRRVMGYPLAHDRMWDETERVEDRLSRDLRTEAVAALAHAEGETHEARWAKAGCPFEWSDGPRAYVWRAEGVRMSTVAAVDAWIAARAIGRGEKKP